MVDRDRVGVRQDRYTRVAIALHWAIAALIIFNLSLGYFMEGFAQPLRGTVVSLHISSGLTVLALTALRVVWRLLHEPPPYPAEMKSWERHAAHFAHFLLYSAMALMPLTGWAIISAHPAPGTPGAAYAAKLKGPPPAPPAAKMLPPTGRPTAPGAMQPPKGAGPKLWGLTPVPSITPIQAIGATPGGVPAQNELHEKFVTWHGFGGYLLIALLLLHIVGALKHQWFDRQPELARMGIGKARRDGGYAV